MTGNVLWTNTEVAAATGSAPTDPWVAGGISIDSRTLERGDLFFAIRGPNFDGHQFVADAFRKGAAAAVVTERPDDVAADAPLVMVGDTLQALRELGAAARSRSAARVIGVTGSVGKTSVKAALKHVLERQGETHASAASLNNHWGVPLSLARLQRDAAYAIFELGMNHPGEIDPLSRLVRPDVAIITTIAPAHIEFFPSLDAIADAKAEIFAGLQPGGFAVLNADIAQFERLRDAATRADAEIITFGHSAAADVRIDGAYLNSQRSVVDVDVKGTHISFTIGAPGPHWVINAACILAAAHGVGADVGMAAAALASVSLQPGRGRVEEIMLDGNAIHLIDDSYNANPVSMRAAIDVLGRAIVPSGGRRIAVLGDMLELGEHAVREHAALGQPLEASGVDLVFTCGPMMSHLHDALAAHLTGGHAINSAGLAPMVVSAVRGGDAVVVKGSAGSKMGVVVEALRALGDHVHQAKSGQRLADGA